MHDAITSTSLSMNELTCPCLSGALQAHKHVTGAIYIIVLVYRHLHTKVHTCMEKQKHIKSMYVASKLVDIISVNIGKITYVTYTSRLFNLHITTFFPEFLIPPNIINSNTMTTNCDSTNVKICRT